MRQYAGVYKNEKDQYQRVELKDGKLWLANYGAELVPQSLSEFEIKLTGGKVSFSSNQMSIQILASEKAEKYSLIQTHAPKDLGGFAGDYYSFELDATWQLRLRDGKLTAHVKHSDSPEVTLDPVTDNTFTIEGGSLRFENEAGSPKRAFLTVDRIRNIEFEKN